MGQGLGRSVWVICTGFKYNRIIISVFQTFRTVRNKARLIASKILVHAIANLIRCVDRS